MYAFLYLSRSLLCKEISPIGELENEKEKQCNSSISKILCKAESHSNAALSAECYWITENHRSKLTVVSVLERFSILHLKVVVYSRTGDLMVRIGNELKNNHRFY